MIHGTSPEMNTPTSTEGMQSLTGGSFALGAVARLTWLTLGAIVLSGCSASSEPTPTPAPTVYRVPAPTATPRADDGPTVASAPTPWGEERETFIPGTRMRPGSAPGTALGPYGDELRFVPTVPGYAPTCRPATDAERAAVVRKATVTTDGRLNETRGPLAAVDLPEDGWSVVAFWVTYNDETYESALVRGGGAASGVGTAWAGTHTYGGAAFADSPQALKVARECLGAS